MGFVSPCSSAPASIIYFLTSINIYLIKKSTNQNTAGDKTENDIKRLPAIQKLEKIMKTPVKCEVGEMNLYKNCKKKERRAIFFKTFFFSLVFLMQRGKRAWVRSSGIDWCPRRTNGTQACKRVHRMWCIGNIVSESLRSYIIMLGTNLWILWYQFILLGKFKLAHHNYRILESVFLNFNPCINWSPRRLVINWSYTIESIGNNNSVSEDLNTPLSRW